MEEILDLEKLKSLSPEQQDQVIMGVKQQAAITNAQNLITAIESLHRRHTPTHKRFLSAWRRGFYIFALDLSEKCTHKCITSPGSSLSNGEKQCLQRCMDRFMDSWNLVSQTLQKRLQDELSAGTSAAGSFS